MNLIMRIKYLIILIIVIVLFNSSHIHSLLMKILKSLFILINETVLNREQIILVFLSILSCYSLESPLRSFLPLQFVSLLKQNIHHHHQLIQNTIELSTNEDYKNVLVLHTNVGLFILDRYNGRSFFTIHHSLIDLLSDIPLSMQKQ